MIFCPLGPLAGPVSQQKHLCWEEKLHSKLRDRERYFILTVSDSNKQPHQDAVNSWQGSSAVQRGSDTYLPPSLPRTAPLMDPSNSRHGIHILFVCVCARLLALACGFAGCWHNCFSSVISRVQSEEEGWLLNNKRPTDAAELALGAGSYGLKQYKTMYQLS